MSKEAIARRWARAIFELGKEEQATARLSRELGEIADTYAGSPELAEVLGNPLVPEPEREAVIAEVATRMGVSPTAKSALLLLGRKRRLAALPEIARQLGRLVDEDGNVVRAQVTSAAPLTEAYLTRLRAELEKATGKKVVIAHSHDPLLIGGVVTRIGDQVIDGSVRARLKSFRDSLLRS